MTTAQGAIGHAAHSLTDPSAASGSIVRRSDSLTINASTTVGVAAIEPPLVSDISRLSLVPLTPANAEGVEPGAETGEVSMQL